MNHFQNILNFQKLLKKFNLIYRDLSSIHKHSEPDNDVEHSFRVAMLCWMVIEEYKLKYDVNKVIQYALVHDMVEIYAGDKSIYSKYKQSDKEAKEHKSLMRLKKEFPNLKSIWKLIETYEKRNDDEAKFVYVIEKLEPVFSIILSEQDHWKKRNVSIDMFVDLKQRKIKNIDTFAQVFNDGLVTYLKKNKKKFFKS